MNPELDPNDIGRQLGSDGVNGVVAKVEQYCAHEERRIALENQAPINALRAEFSLLVDEERRLKDLLRDAPPPGDLRHHGRKKIFYWAVAIVLTITGFCLAVYTFAPFRLGWPGYLFCAGIATVVPFLVEKLLDDHRFEVVVKALTAIAAVAGIASLMLLADVRSHLLAHEIQSPPQVVIDDAQPAEPAPQDDFYGATLGSLRLATVLLSFAMELGAGLALREAWVKAPHNTEDWQRLRAELANVHQQMVSLASQITRLECEPAIFEARFWRDFYKSMLTHTVQSAMKKLLILVAAALIVPHALAATPQRLNLVVAFDLSRSVDVKNPDGTTEFQKNVDGVTGVLAQVPAGSHVTVIGITDRSFAQPYILLSASILDDPGYFGERLSAAQRELVRVWKQRSAKLQPKFSGTDILGAFELASQIFNQLSSGGEHKALVLFSDLRNHTRELDLETASGLTKASENSGSAFERRSDLHNAQVIALGVETSRRLDNSWEPMEALWRKYLDASGVRLVMFSPLRTIPEAALK
jgi:hypothetical protein